MATTPAMTESGSIIFKRVDMPATSGWDITAQSPAHRDSDQGLPLKAIHLPGESERHPRSGTVAKPRLKSDYNKTNICPSADILPVVRPKVRSLLQKSL